MSNAKTNQIKFQRMMIFLGMSGHPDGLKVAQSLTPEEENSAMNTLRETWNPALEAKLAPVIGPMPEEEEPESGTEY